MSGNVGIRPKGAILSLFAAVALAACGRGKGVDRYVKDASALQAQGKLEDAAAVMEQAVGKHPKNAQAHAYLGLYLGMQAGRTQDFMRAGNLVSTAFEHLDRAVSIDSMSPDARYFRGLLGVQVPDFLGRLGTGVRDLEFLVQVLVPKGNVDQERVVSAWSLLGSGYQKRAEFGKAKAAWSKVVELAPSGEPAQRAQEALTRLDSEAGAKPAADVGLPEDLAELVRMGKAHLDAGEIEKAAEALRKATELDRSSGAAFRLLATALERLARVGYDERIALDTDRRTSLAFEYTRALDRLVELCPDDVEVRLWRGGAAVHMPFFVGRLDQGISDLERVLASDVPEETRAEALYLLGLGYRRKATSKWIEVVTKHPKAAAAADVFRQMSPGVKRFDPDRHARPLVVIDFVLGFRDELEPQVAVWVEDGKDRFIKTVYVSGFSGHAKAAQVDLSRWAKASAFRDCDAVTAASIDIGHHIYVWDLKDHGGRKVEPGEYAVKVEGSWWPSMKYQLAEASVMVGRGERRRVVEEGYLIPYLELRYLPE